VYTQATSIDPVTRPFFLPTLVPFSSDENELVRSQSRREKAIARNVPVIPIIVDDSSTAAKRQSTMLLLGLRIVPGRYQCGSSIVRR